MFSCVARLAGDDCCCFGSGLASRRSVAAVEALPYMASELLSPLALKAAGCMLLLRCTGLLLCFAASEWRPSDQQLAGWIRLRTLSGRPLGWLTNRTLIEPRLGRLASRCCCFISALLAGWLFCRLSVVVIISAVVGASASASSSSIDPLEPRLRSAHNYRGNNTVHLGQLFVLL